MTQEQVMLLESLNTTVKLICIGTLIIVILLVASMALLDRRIRHIEEKIEDNIMQRIESLEFVKEMDDAEVNKRIRQVVDNEVHEQLMAFELGGKDSYKKMHRS